MATDPHGYFPRQINARDLTPAQLEEGNRALLGMRSPETCERILACMSQEEREQYESIGAHLTMKHRLRDYERALARSRPMFLTALARLLLNDGKPIWYGDRLPS